MKNKKKPLDTLKMALYAIILISVLTGMIEAASASTTIKVADNGHYFEYDGQQEFLLGLGNWIVINKIDVDYVAHNQWYQSYGLNYNRITLTSTWYTDRSKQVFPWKRSTTPGANDGGNKFDLKEWDPAFWDRLKGYLQDCEDRGIIVCIQIFDECAVERGTERWNQHPFNPQNNINSIPDLGTTDASYSSSTGWSRSFYNVDNSVLMTLQDKYVQKLLDETSQYGNIIYEMANEYGGEGSTQFPGHFAWPQHWIDFFCNYETTNGVQLLLTNMPFGANYDQAEYFAASGIDCIDAYRQFHSYRDVQGVNEFLGAHYNEGKPIFSGKISNDLANGGGLNVNRKRLWTLFVSGGAGSGIKGYPYADDWTDDRSMEKMLTNIRNFIDSGVEFWNMVPKDSLVTSGAAYSLANIGQEYVIYHPDGGSVTVDLSDASGTLAVEWYNPRDGTYHDGVAITGGGSETFTPPFSGDAVLHIFAIELALDTTPPSAVTDLAASNPTSNSITLAWTAPGDDGNTGAASQYDIRYSTTEISEANWNAATLCTGEPTPQIAGSDETFTVTGLSSTTTYYFALKTADEVPNWAGISNCASGTTTEETNLVAEWHLDDGSGPTAVDTSGNSNDGTIYGASWTDGKLGKGLSFDGTDDYIDCGQGSSLKITGAITVEAWVKWAGAGNPYIVTKSGGSGRRSFHLSGNDDGTVEFRVGGADCNTVKSSGTTPISTGEWVYLVGTYEPSCYVRLFVDGSLAKENIVSIPASQGDNELPWYIGAREGNLGWFNGIIDEVKIHNRALSAEEIRENYEAGSSNLLPTTFIDSIMPDPSEQGKDTVSFTGHGTDIDGSIVAYNWRSSIEGLLSTASSFSKPASELSVGAHTIYFKVQDDGGAWSTEVTEDLAILEPANQPPVSDPNGPYRGTEGEPIVYDGSGSYDPDGSIVAYEWDFGDGDTATGVAPTHTYAQNGTFSVSLTVTDNDGATNTSTTTATIADTEPTAEFSASPTTGDVPLTVTFTDNSAAYDGIEAWEWDFDNDGITDSTVRNPTHEYTEDGVYTVGLKVYESDGNFDTMTKMDYIMVTRVNRAPYAPDNPSPSDEASEVSIDESLSWTGGDSDDDDTVTYDVYFGTSISPPLVAESQPGTTYDPGTQEYSTEFYWRIVATDNHGASNESGVWSFTTASSPGSDLVGEWHLDEGSGITAVDSTGNGNDGTLVNNPAWVNGKIGKALSLDGTNDYVVCGQDSSLKITGAITVEAWVKWLGAGNPYFVTKTGGPGRRSYDLSGNDDGAVEFRVGGADCNRVISSGRFSIPAGEWVHLVGTYEPSSYVRLFVDGSLVRENIVSIPASQGDNGLPWYIGAREGNQGWFNGIIDEVRIYNGALTPEEVRADCETGSQNHPPTAIIDSIAPDPSEQGKKHRILYFTDHGTDTDGSVVAYSQP